MTGTRREERLKAWAREAGFDVVGIAQLDRVEHAAAFEAWVARGDHATMSWLEGRRRERLDPRNILESGRSAVCVGVRYGPEPGPPPGDLWPRVARYARGDDYHDFMTAALRDLGARIESAFPGTRTRSYVDTGPILERELAVRAGLGAFGKNTMLLSPEAGSWLLLGEVLTTLDLEPDPPIADLCGSCTRCLEACPTGALPEAYRLDSRRCLSYWTIEHRGPFPETLGEEIGRGLADWVFGCDICQEVCPWNADPDPVDRAEFVVPERRRALRLADLAKLGRAEYTELFRGSPMKRAKLEGLRRNAAAAPASSAGPVAAG